MLSKKVILTALTVFAIIFGILGFREGSSFRDTFWLELFWLTAGTILTTFVLEAVLRRDTEKQRRKEDQFAFRIFTATLLALLLDMVDASSDLENELAASALTDGNEFSKVARRACKLIQEGRLVRPQLYEASYLDVANQLRDFSHGYIRLLSSSRQEMVQTYRTLQELARSWIYRDEFTSQFQEYTRSLEASNPARQSREQEQQRALQSVGKLLGDTAQYVSELAERVTLHTGMPAAP